MAKLRWIRSSEGSEYSLNGGRGLRRNQDADAARGRTGSDPIWEGASLDQGMHWGPQKEKMLTRKSGKKEWGARRARSQTEQGAGS